MRLGSILGIGVTVLAAVTVSAQINAEYRVKTAFLYNVVKFIEWPPDAWSGPGDPIVVCALGTSPRGDTLAQVVEWKAGRGQPLCRRQIQPTSDSESKRILTILADVRRGGALTI